MRSWQEFPPRGRTAGTVGGGETFSVASAAVATAAAVAVAFVAVGDAVAAAVGA